MTESATIDLDVPADNQNRLQALDPLRSVCVTAPAGSGKTELLSQRVLRLLGCVEQPEEILAITFTRKAAGEMHHRIVEALVAARDQGRPEQPHKQLSWQFAQEVLRRDAEKGWRLLENPSRLKIQTIDSFCASLTRQMPVLSNFGAQPQIAGNAERFFLLAIEQFLTHLEDDGRVGEALEVLLSHIDNDISRLERLLINLLQRRDQWLLSLGVGGEIASAKALLQKTLQRIVIDGIGNICRHLKPWAAELLPLMDYAGSQMHQQHSDSVLIRLQGITSLPPVTVAAKQDWNAIVELLLTKPPKPTFRRSLTKNCGFPTETAEGDKQLAKQRKSQMTELLTLMAEDDSLLAALSEFFHLPATDYPDSQWQLLESLVVLLPTLIAELNLVFQQYGCVDYSQISLAALQSLGDALDPTALALKLDYRLRHILIDEFQDTSSTQFRLLQRLTDGWAEHNAENPHYPNTLFLVGDGMQSIYGFREANVGLFLEARKFGVNGITLDDLPLTVNFRSDPVVVGWNNQVFTRAFPAEENLARGAVPYESAVAFNRPGEACEVAVFGFLDQDAQIREAEYLTDLICQLQENHPQENIAVLVRTRNHLKALIAELSRRDMSWNAAEINSLKDYACIQDLLCLTRAMLHLGDRVSWAALLRTAWFGFSNADLFYLLGRKDNRSVYQSLLKWTLCSEQLTFYARERLAQQLPKITAALQERQRLGVREWIEGLWLSLGGAAGLRDAREFEMVDSYFGLLEEQFSTAQNGSLAEFEQALHRLYAKPQSNDSQLHLMTIHKSKGLEFDTVIVPALAQSPRSDDKSLLMWNEYLSPQGDFSGLVVSPIPAPGEDDATYDYLRYEQSQSQNLENTRLLYVAATRAIKRLYLSFATETDEKTASPKLPRKDSLIASLWPAISDQVQWMAAPPELQSGQGQLGITFDIVDRREHLLRQAATWRPPNWHFPNPLSEFYLNSCYEGDNRPEQAQDEYASAVGSVIHKVLEVLYQRSIDFWQGMKQENKQRWLHALLRSHGVMDEQLQEGSQQVSRAIENTIGDSKGRWLLSRGGKYDYAELAVSSIYEERIRHRVIDRVLSDSQGVLWIVDYKSGQPAEGQSLREFLQQEGERYRGQLQDYQWHISQLLSYTGPIKLAIYFTALPQFLELP